MAKMLSGHYACLDTVTCCSSDARRLYDDGTSFCFSCNTFFPAQDGDSELNKPSPSPSPKIKPWHQKLSPSDIKTYPIRGFRNREITKTVCEFFEVRVTYDEDGVIAKHYYPYDGGEAFKIRSLPKEFVWVGKSTGLFGKEKFPGAGRRLVITEGEIDTLSVAQASLTKYSKIYPVVGLSSAVMTKSLLENRDWIRSFAEVVLMLDQDEAGEKATSEAIKIIGHDKVKVAKLPCKDPNEVLLKHGADTLLQCMFDAAPFIPAGIIGKEALWDALVNYNNIESHPYCKAMAGVNTKLKGKRFGEIVLYISGTGSGKSTLLREEILNILETSIDKIGVVSLEESPAETARKLSGMAIHKNPAKEEIPIEEIKVGFDKVFGDDRIILLDHQGSINDSRIIDQLEYMCLSGCKYLFIDHITIMVSEGVENLTGNEAQDKVMNDLLRLVKRYNVWVGLVSHLRKAPNGGKSFEEGKLPSIDDIRGSGSIKQISFDIISFARNLTADNEEDRNTIKMRVLKSRYTGLTGTVNGARYIYDTGRLEATSTITDDFVEI